MTWDQWRDDYEREDQRNDAARDWAIELADQAAREANEAWETDRLMDEAA